MVEETQVHYRVTGMLIEGGQGPQGPWQQPPLTDEL